MVDTHKSQSNTEPNHIKKKEDSSLDYPKLSTILNQALHPLTDKQQLYMILVIAVLVRACIGLSPYSGENTPPKYGDFECHRMWMEITSNMPVHTWYTDSKYMNTTYWPMDYPPLCAYTHYAMAKVVNLITPEAIVLG